MNKEKAIIIRFERTIGSHTCFYSRILFEEEYLSEDINKILMEFLGSALRNFKQYEKDIEISIPPVSG